jgi:uncharacterized protein YwbE
MDSVSIAILTMGLSTNHVLAEAQKTGKGTVGMDLYILGLLVGHR